MSTTAALPTCDRCQAFVATILLADDFGQTVSAYCIVCSLSVQQGECSLAQWDDLHRQLGLWVTRDHNAAFYDIPEAAFKHRIAGSAHQAMIWTEWHAFPVVRMRVAQWNDFLHWSEPAPVRHPNDADLAIRNLLYAAAHIGVRFGDRHVRREECEQIELPVDDPGRPEFTTIERTRNGFDPSGGTLDETPVRYLVHAAGEVRVGA